MQMEKTTMTATLSGARPLPGPSALPGLGWRGNLLPLARDPIPYMEHLWHTYGDVVTLAAGSTAFIFVFSPEYHHQILSDPGRYHNGDIRSPAVPIRLPPDSAALRLFSGITTMNGAKHTQQRRMLLLAFHRQRIAALREEMIAET